MDDRAPIREETQGFVLFHSYSKIIQRFDVPMHSFSPARFWEVFGHIREEDLVSGVNDAISTGQMSTRVLRFNEMAPVKRMNHYAMYSFQFDSQKHVILD